jgi:hypothetical protein
MKTEKINCELKGDIYWFNLRGIDSFSQNIPMSTTEKRTAEPAGDAFEDTAFSQGLQLSNSKPVCRTSAPLL